MDIILAIFLGALVTIYVPFPVVLKLLIVSNLVLTLVAVRLSTREAKWGVAYRGVAVAILAAIFVPALLNYEIPHAGLYVLVLLFAVSVYFSVMFRGSMRAAWISAAAAVGVLVCTEIYASNLLPWQGSAISETQYTFDGTRWREGKVYDVQPHPVLGYVNRPKLKVREVRKNQDRVIYDATYSTDAKGSRITGFERENARSRIVFLGDSFIFGQGVNDDQTLAAAFGRDIDARDVSIHNLGVVGWGIHQDVAMLEDDLVREKVGNGKIQYGVYIGIYDHVRRALGLATWAGTGPHYVLNEDGSGVTRRGQFGEGAEGKALGGLKQFNLFNRYFSPLLLGNAALDLYAALVEEASSEFNQRYGGELLVLYWPELTSRAFDRGIIGRLKNRKVRVIAVDEIIPDFWQAYDRYHIVGDRHPTALAYAKVGEFLANDFKSRMKSP